METNKLNDGIQIAGVVALVASLVFVGLQLKQTRDVAIAGQYQERYATAVEFYIGREQSEVQVRYTGKQEMSRHGLPDGIDANIAPEEYGSLFIYARLVLAQFDNHHFQYQAGTSTEEAWATHEAGLRSVAAMPLFQHVVEARRDMYRASFRELFEALRQEQEDASN